MAVSGSGSAPSPAAQDARVVAEQLCDALSGAMVATNFECDPDWKDDNDATWWFCRKALWDYADSRGDGWEPYCMDDRDDPPATVSYEAKLAALKGSFGWVINDARASRDSGRAPEGEES